MGKTASHTELVRLLVKHRRSLFAYIYAVTRDRDVSDEIFQEVGVVVCDHAQRGTEVERFVGWAVGIARRQIASWYRTAQRRRQMVPMSDQMAEVLAQAIEENRKFLDQEETRFAFLQECLDGLVGAAER